MTKEQILEIEELAEALQIYILEKMKDNNIKIVIDSHRIEVIELIGVLEKQKNENGCSVLALKFEIQYNIELIKI